MQTPPLPTARPNPMVCCHQHGGALRWDTGLRCGQELCQALPGLGGRSAPRDVTVCTPVSPWPCSVLQRLQAAQLQAHQPNRRKKSSLSFASPSQKQFKFCFLHLLLLQALVARTELRLQQRVG